MPTQILAIGTSATNSADVVVAAGTPLTVALKGASPPGLPQAQIDILIKDDAGNYFLVDYLASPGPDSTRVIQAPGTYRFSRPAGPAVGVFSG